MNRMRSQPSPADGCPAVGTNLHPPGLRARAGEQATRPTTGVASACLAAALLAGCAAAPPAATAPTGGTAAQAHARLLDHANNCNEAAYLAAWAPLFTLATSTTPQPVTTREGLQRHLATGCGKGPRPGVSLVQQSTRVSGAITVFAGQYRYRLPAAPGATAAEVLQNFTVVLERMGDRWLVLAQHVSVAP